MENVSFNNLNKAIDSLSNSKSLDLPTLADALHVAKIARERSENAWEALRNIVRTSEIEEAQSDNIKVSVSFRKGAMRYDSKKLSAYFEKNKIDPLQFKTQDNDSIVISIKQK